MGRIVYQGFESLSVSADASQDIFSIIAGSANKIKIHGFELTSNAVAAAIVACHFHRITAAGSVGGSSTTEEKADEDAGAFAANVRTLDTTPGADGGLLMGYQWEQLGPVGHIFTPKMAPLSEVSEGFAFTWDTAIAATLSGWLCWEEI